VTPAGGERPPVIWDARSVIHKRVLLLSGDAGRMSRVREALSDGTELLTATADDGTTAMPSETVDLMLVDAAGAESARLPATLARVPVVALVPRGDADLLVRLVHAGIQDWLTLEDLCPQRRAAATAVAEARIVQARMGTLTGLPDRALLYDRLGQAVHQARRYDQLFAVMFIDLDRFKLVNDSLGHDAGDDLLREVAARLRAALRESDTVARFGGDEFVAIVNNLPNAMSASAIAAKVNQHLAHTVRVAGADVHVTPSIGIAMFPADGDSVDELITCADRAMYQAKRAGGGQYMYYRPDMNADALRRIGLAFAMQRALNDRQFVLHYQPQVDLKTGRTVAVEALVRWNHPERGLVPPADFIPIAEELGLMAPLGRWVLNAACEQARQWRAAGLPPLRIAVNLSAYQFDQPGLLLDVRNALYRADLSPDALELELTESSVMRDPDRATETLRALAGIGVRIAIDDFGTGYSSLAHLHRFPIHLLKVDRSFVADVHRDADAAAIVRTIIALGRNMNLEIVAEGVETSEQATFLRRSACHRGQGFGYSRPLPPERLADYLRQRPAALQVIA
jgi:diguanylate cyclase (GGDEF)-like protein